MKLVEKINKKLSIRESKLSQTKWMIDVADEDSIVYAGALTLKKGTPAKIRNFLKLEFPKGSGTEFTVNIHREDPKTDNFIRKQFVFDGDLKLQPEYSVIERHKLSKWDTDAFPHIKKYDKKRYR